MQQSQSKTVIILCGGDINLSDLPIVTNRSNAMIPVNGKPVIGWILDELEKKQFSEVVLVLRFDNTKLFNYVQWAFGNRIKVHFAFVQPGGTILHSLLSGLEMVQEDRGVHVVLGDTLIQDELPAAPDFVFAGPFQNPEDWCLVETDEAGFAVAYYDKQQQTEAGWQALAGVYSLSDIQALKQSVMNQLRNGAKEISSVLKEYGSRHRVMVQNAKAWYDFGHIEYFNLAKQKLLQSRYFNSLSIDSLRGTISKTSLKHDKLEDELAWYKALPSSLRMFCPRLEEQELNPKKVVITQEYYGYPNLAELYVFGDLAPSVWKNALHRLMEIHLELGKHRGQVDPEDVVDMYTTKTGNRLAELANQEGWDDRLASETIVLNGKAYQNYRVLAHDINERVAQLSTSCRGSIIHGDYCFSNILYDLNTQVVRLIDPRGSFGNQKLYGDPRYDIAKLRHSLAGRYDFILADLFMVKQEGAGFHLEIVETDSYKALVGYFDQLVADFGYDPEDIKLIEGLLFISMVPLHRENPKRQLAMYLTGIKQVNEVIHHAYRN